MKMMMMMMVAFSQYLNRRFKDGTGINANDERTIRPSMQRVYQRRCGERKNRRKHAAMYVQSMNARETISTLDASKSQDRPRQLYRKKASTRKSIDDHGNTGCIAAGLGN